MAPYDQGYGLISWSDATGDLAYFTFSPIGNTSELTSSSGLVQNSYACRPFGISINKTETVAKPFEYGVMYEANRLKYMRARHYTDESGRFLQEDAITTKNRGQNPYSYVANDPVSWIDPLGTTRSRADELLRGTDNDDLSFAAENLIHSSPSVLTITDLRSRHRSAAPAPSSRGAHMTATS